MLCDFQRCKTVDEVFGSPESSDNLVPDLVPAIHTAVALEDGDEIMRTGEASCFSTLLTVAQA